MGKNKGKKKDTKKEKKLTEEKKVLKDKEKKKEKNTNKKKKLKDKEKLSIKEKKKKEDSDKKDILRREAQENRQEDNVSAKTEMDSKSGESSYEIFLEKNPSGKSPQRQEGFKEIFAILEKKSSLEAMEEAIAIDQAPLGALIPHLEKLYQEDPSIHFDLKDIYTKSTIGRMVSFLLGQRGYRSIGNRAFPADKGFQYFRSASFFAKIGQGNFDESKI